MGDYNEPCVLVTNERAGKAVSANWQPMKDWINVTGQGLMSVKSFEGRLLWCLVWVSDIFCNQSNF